jgi:hypothetical protein
MAAIWKYLSGDLKTDSAEERIARTVCELLTAAFPQSLRAVVLTGSLARGEGTWIGDEVRYRLAGDAEFLVVFKEHAAQLRSAALVSELARAVENQLHDAGVEAHIGLSPVGPEYLRRLRPHIFAYELLEHGEVIWGDGNILTLVRAFSIADIALEDGFQVLVNRIIELLEALSNSSGSISHCVQYRATKLWLDMATSFLLFEREYESTYRRRADKLAQMVLAATGIGGITAGPIPLNHFSERVQLATDYKLGKSDRAPIICGENLAGLIEDAHSLWRWELARLVRSDPSASDDELLSRWTRAQDVVGRMRGWAAIVKRFGPRASARLMPRWARWGLVGSPRRLIYGVASQLFFALPAILAHRVGGSYGKWTRRLPVMNESASAPSWQNVGRAVAWNYHHFLEGTRS